MSEYQSHVNRAAYAGDLWRAAVSDAEAKRKKLVAAVKAANDGGVSEYTLAIECGVSRRTIRAWLGK